jgi:hypothetical protein
VRGGREVEIFTEKTVLFGENKIVFICKMFLLWRGVGSGHIRG